MGCVGFEGGVASHPARVCVGESGLHGEEPSFDAGPLLGGWAQGGGGVNGGGGRHGWACRVRGA
jgi:hypothetical protein